jgi:hypothetical protein
LDAVISGIYSALTKRTSTSFPIRQKGVHRASRTVYNVARLGLRLVKPSVLKSCPVYFEWGLNSILFNRKPLSPLWDMCEITAAVLTRVVLHTYSNKDHQPQLIRDLSVTLWK